MTTIQTAALCIGLVPLTQRSRAEDIVSIQSFLNLIVFSIVIMDSRRCLPCHTGGRAQFRQLAHALAYAVHQDSL